MAKYNNTTIVVTEGLSIRKYNSPFYQYHFRINGNAKRKTTGTGDLKKAKKIALDAYQQAQYEAKNGISKQTISFNNLTTKYLQSIIGEKKSYFHEGTLNRHLKPFFSKFSDISKIKITHLDDYLSYRRGKCSAVTNSSINKENAVFNQMMRFAFEREWIEKAIKIKTLKETSNPRPHFTKDELKLLIRTSQKRIDEFKNNNFTGKEKGLYQEKLWSRELIHDLVFFVVDTGVRPCELKTITWQDVDLEKRTVKLNNAGKVKSSRTLYIRTQKGVDALKRLKERRTMYAETHNQHFQETEKIQSYCNGKSVKDIEKEERKQKKAFGSFLMSTETKSEDLPELLEELDRISSFEYGVHIADEDEGRYIPAAKHANTVYERVVYNRNATVAPIITGITNYIEECGIKKGKIKGYDPDGIEKLIKISENPSFFAEYDFDTAVGEIEGNDIDDLANNWVVDQLAEVAANMDR